MTEPKKTRWDICEQCVGVRKHWIRGVWTFVRESRDRGEEWHNPLILYFYSTLTTELCLDCPHRLEFSVMNQELTND